VSTLAELASASQALAEAIRGLSPDPGDAMRLLAPLAALQPSEATAGDVVGLAQAAGQAAAAALCRRAALAALARATAEASPPSHDAAVALRDQVCGLLAAEEVVAADAGEDAAALALRDLRAAVAEDLTRRAADMARLRTVTVPEPLPALVHAYRLYEDLSRADEVSLQADAEDPNFIGGTFRVLGA
jgi:prophage DNA circulation protein